MVEEEAVLLDLMSGFEFEDFFARLLTELGYGQVEQVLYTQDEAGTSSCAGPKVSSW